MRKSIYGKKHDRLGASKVSLVPPVAFNLKDTLADVTGEF